MSSISTPLRLLSAPRAKAMVVVLFAVVAGFYLVLPVLMGRAAGDLRHAVWSYNGAAIGLSWFDTGFARRELEGTLIRLFSADPMAGGLVFHLLASVAFAGLNFMATLRAAVPERERLAIGAVFLAVLANLAVDVGRADPAIMICGLVAAWGSRTARWMVTAAALSIALAFHETGFIVLAPLIACIAWEHGTWRAGGTTSRLLGLALAAAGVAGYVVALAAHPDAQAVGRKIHAEFAYPKLADLSVYYTLSGGRGLATILCQQRLDGEYLCKILKGIGLIGVLSFALRPRRRLLTFAVAAAPFLFLSAIAVDISRWSVFAAFVIATMAVTDRAAQAKGAAVPGPVGAAVLAVAAAVLMMIRPTVIEVRDPLPIIPNFVYDSGAGTITPIGVATQCDPGWRQYIGLAN